MDHASRCACPLLSAGYVLALQWVLRRKRNYAIAYFCGEAMPEPMRCELRIVGGVLIVSSDLAILGIKDCKTINLLPSLLIPVAFYLIKGLFC